MRDGLRRAVDASWRANQEAYGWLREREKGGGMSEQKYYNWIPTAHDMVEDIRLAIREQGEGAVGRILDTVADTLMDIDYMVPIEETRGWRRGSAALITAASDWVRNAWKCKHPKTGRSIL